MKVSWNKIKNDINKLNNHLNLTEKKAKIFNSQQFDYKTEKHEPVYNDNKKETNLKTIHIVAFIWIFTITFYLVLFFSLSGIANKVSEEINLKKNSSFSLYKPGIDVINSLKKTDYIKYIQRIYVHPEQENRLMVLIRSNYWGILSSEEKEKMISKIMSKWEKIYTNSDSEENLAPEVYFANI